MQTPPKPTARVIRGTLPPLLPTPAAAQDATAPGSLYRSNPSSPAAQSNERGSLAGGAVRLLRKALPINAAMFAQDLTGNKVPLTEKDLTLEELNVMRKTARTAEGKPVIGKAYDGKPFNRSEINYDSYPNVDGKFYQSDPNNLQELKQAITNPVKRMGTTIGGAMLEKRPGNASVLTDSFDFGGADRGIYNEAKEAGVLPSAPRAAWNVLRGVALPRNDNSAYENLRYLAGHLGSTADGKGIPVNLNLGNLKRPLPGEFPAPPPRIIRGTQK